MIVLEWICFDRFFSLDFSSPPPLFFEFWPFDQLNLNQSVRFDSRIDVDFNMVELENR